MDLRLLLCLSLVACAGVDNPTGDCRPLTNGGRVGYHSPMGAQYLPHCDGVLDREYYRVFADRQTGTAALIPRADGEGERLGLCADAELGDLFQRTGHCDSPADPSIVNTMTPADALAVQQALHERLLFAPTPDGSRVWPAALPDDILAICEDGLGALDATADWCGAVSAQVRSGTEMAILEPSDALQTIADALNDLYGTSR